MKTEIAVFGGGIAGFHTAVVASRLGKKVTLIERTSSIGGLATLGLVNPFMKYWLNGEKLVKGIFEELLNRVEKKGGLFFNIFDSETMKIEMLKMLKENSVNVLFNTVPYYVKTENNRINSVKLITSIGEKLEITADFFIDATGDGTLAYLSGATVFSGNVQGENQALTVMFTMGGVDFEKVKEDVSNNRENFFPWVDPDMKIVSVAGYFEEIERARKDGLEFPNKYFFYNQLPGNGRITVNTTHIGAKTTNISEISRAIFEGVEQIELIIKFTKTYLKGFENAYLEKIAPSIGIRESRRIKGLYVFTGEDVKNLRKFEDGVVKACYGIDVHPKDAQSQKIDKTVPPQPNDYYEIPLRSLISSEFENLGIAGRCLSADFLGQSAARIMPTCAGMGQAIGFTCSLSDGSLWDLDFKKVKKLLEEEGFL
ncbi:MAG: hypothetical protein PWQ20_697 [Thermotogaceae bacterium]|jgi:hypothetical protein|nr:hypothetical protein [Thermotogaceae bacterium]MDN5337627.1 hypothetical protein [Thermotogaceae bacterium]